MKYWSWQKWVGKLLPFVLGVALLAWKLISDDPNFEPPWWPTISAFATVVVQTILSLFPPKATG